MATTIIAPGIALVVVEFSVNNVSIATLSVSIYLLGFAIGPLTIASLSELYGRLVVTHTCNALFILFVVGCALSKNINQFIIFRFLSGYAGSAPLTLGGGIIADCIPLEKRGLAGAIYGLGPFLGPVSLYALFLS